ncbi:MAG: addiction module protein [Burkholderiales bacterium]|nr:addiction module protein [Burkholderiales bacterium]
MSRPLDALAEEVLQLPTEDRSKLLDRVVASLDADRKRDEAWDALAAHRDAEIESGQSKAISGPEVLARLRAELK